MNKFFILGIAVVLVGVCSLSSVQAAQFGPFGQQQGRTDSNNNRGDRVCLYENANYEGWEQCLGPGEDVADLRGHSNKTSAIRIFGRARVDVYDDTNFRGAHLLVTDNVANLNALSLPRVGVWNDRIKSLRVDFDRNSSSPRTSREPRDGVCVYDSAGFRGRAECWSAGESLADLTRSGADWSDRISSIRVFGRAEAELYSDTRFRGERLVVDRDITDLSQIRVGPGQGRGPQGRGQSDRGRGVGNRSWNDQVSSLRVLQVSRNTNSRR